MNGPLVQKKRMTARLVPQLGRRDRLQATRDAPSSWEPALRKC